MPRRHAVQRHGRLLPRGHPLRAPCGAAPAGALRQHAAAAGLRAGARQPRGQPLRARVRHLPLLRQRLQVPGGELHVKPALQPHHPAVRRRQQLCLPGGLMVLVGRLNESCAPRPPPRAPPDRQRHRISRLPLSERTPLALACCAPGMLLRLSAASSFRLHLLRIFCVCNGFLKQAIATNVAGRATPDACGTQASSSTAKPVGRPSPRAVSTLSALAQRPDLVAAVQHLVRRVVHRHLRQRSGARTLRGHQASRCSAVRPTMAELSPGRAGPQSRGAPRAPARTMRSAGALATCMRRLGLQSRSPRPPPPNAPASRKSRSRGA